MPHKTQEQMHQKHILEKITHPQCAMSALTVGMPTLGQLLTSK